MGRGLGEVQYHLLAGICDAEGSRIEYHKLQYPFPIERWHDLPRALIALAARGLIAIDPPKTAPSFVSGALMARGTILEVTEQGRAAREHARKRFTYHKLANSRQLDWTDKQKGG